MQLSVFPKQKHQFFFALGVVFLAFGVFSTMSAYKNEDAIKESIRNNRNARILSDDVDENFRRIRLESVLVKDLEQEKKSVRLFFIMIFGISGILMIIGFLVQSRANAKNQNGKT